MHFIKSRLARMGLGNHSIFGSSKSPGEPLINQQSTSTPYIPMVLPNPPASTARKHGGSKTWVDQTADERTWNPGQIPSSPGTSSPAPKPPQPLDTAPNYRLPFDILVQIFEQFAEMENASSPLERVLEVCHFWRDTALDHRVLWTTFRMVVTSPLDVSYWRKQFPRRADRLGSDALLDISIELVNQRVERLILPCGIYQVDRAGRRTHTRACHALRILGVIGGRHGARAVRWRALSLNLLHLGDLMDQDYVVLDRFLEARTPHLQSLELYGIVTPYRVHKRIFPYTPRLRRAVFHSCQVSHYPDTSALTSLTWYSTQDTSAYPQRNTAAIHALTSAQKITYLEIGLDWTYWDTSMVFKRVRTLKMPGTVYPDFVIMIQVSSLRHLAIGVDPAAKFSYIQDCKGIPIAQVETLELFYVPRDSSTSEEIAAAPDDAAAVEGLKVFFSQLINLRVLSWDEGMVTQKALLKSVLELFIGGSVGDNVVQKAGSITKRV